MEFKNSAGTFLACPWTLLTLRRSKRKASVKMYEGSMEFAFPYDIPTVLAEEPWFQHFLFLLYCIF